jgi:hypothetical protein
MHQFYRYLNAFFTMTLLPKGGNQVNVLGDSQTLLSFNFALLYVTQKDPATQYL